MAGEQGSAASAPAATKEQLAARIRELTAEVNKLKKEKESPELVQLLQTVTQINADTAQANYKSKIHFPGPEKFGGTREKLRPFLTYMRAYHEHYGIETVHDKVVTTAGFLTGDAASWFEPTLRDYFEHDKRN